MDKVCHFEIPVENLLRAKAFYREVFDWHIISAEMPENDYHLVETVSTTNGCTPSEVGAINGGMVTRQNAEEKPLIVIDVKDIKQCLSQIEAQGGKVIMPVVPVGGFGLYARFEDPEGNIMGLWEAINSAD